MKGYRLPEGLLLGAASSAAQTEGGGVAHSWTGWAGKGRIRDGSDISRGNGHWKRWKEDIDIMAAMGIETWRFNPEWARIQPRPGYIDNEVVNHYRAEIEYLMTRGIRPLLVIHHFTNPEWFEERGGFALPANAKYFLKYVGLVVNCFGDLVSDYVTFNEPNYYAFAAYGGVGFPPGDNNPVTVRRVLSVMAGCHIRAYRKIHRMREAMGYADTKVGVAFRMWAYEPVHPGSLLEERSAGLSRYLFQDVPAKAFLKGEFHGAVENLAHFKRGVYCDYAGIVYFGRLHVNKPGVPSGGPTVNRSDDGREIYPQGLAEVISEISEICERPVWVLGNGVCDAEDSFRSQYIYDHLAVIARSRVPVQRYYYWSFTDSFEWLDGEGSRFGLVGIDYGTGNRKVRKSGHFYRELISCHGVTAEMAERYIRGERYHM